MIATFLILKTKGVF